ncbi:MAG TPA: sigma-70 family RNA polymerase sigma factor [Bryobacteraceae bacterium]|jgi:RNA polymerase sigma-70 factor (ECF subfamily)|nr:sigma-70 family RNA polymerase sigma factor [Bryobacteraceae bacterium]
MGRIASQSADLPPERQERWRRYLSDIATGDPQALASLYDEAGKSLYSLALRILRNAADAEEVLLEVFDQVWRNAHTFDPARGSVWRWLTLLTRSRALDRLRSSGSKQTRERTGVFEDWEISSHDPPPDETSMFRQQQLLIRKALYDLPPEQRTALELAYFSELTHVEIATTLQVPLGTIKTRIRMGMDKLRVALGHGSSRAVALTN